MHTPAGLPAKARSVNESTCTMGWRFIVSLAKSSGPWRIVRAGAREIQRILSIKTISTAHGDVGDEVGDSRDNKLFPFHDPHHRLLISIISIDGRAELYLPDRL